jgi:methyl-accepting chemotaxis protein
MGWQKARPCRLGASQTESAHPQICRIQEKKEMQLTLGRKLALGFGSILTLMLISGSVSILKIREMHKVQDVMVGVRTPTLTAALALQREMFQTGSKSRQAILAGSQSDRRRDGIDRFQKTWESADNDMAALTELSSHWVEQENRDRLAKIKAVIGKSRELQQAAIDMAAGHAPDAIEKAGDNYADKATPAVDAVAKSLGDLVASNQELIKQDAANLASASDSVVWTLSISTGVVLLIGIAVAFFVIRDISAAANREKIAADEVAKSAEREKLAAQELGQKVDSILTVVSAASHGDLTHEIQVQGSDAIGQMGEGLGKFFADLRKSIGSIGASSMSLASASEQLTTVSQQMSANAEETSAQTKVVSGATLQVSQNLQTVATGAEEMGASIKEIAKNATEAAKIANSAVRAAETANTTVSKLGDSSAEIGQVIKVITSIAQQTNLLALNATIEAARAGEAGKGFAVVANEVKELAKKTAKATEDISRKIETIQVDAKAAVDSIGTISEVINQINGISNTIATAVEEQNATTNEMARNVSEAAHGSGEITSNIAGVAQAAESTSRGASDTQKAAQQLVATSAELRRLVEQFKIDDGNSGQRNAIPRQAIKTAYAGS